MKLYSVTVFRLYVHLYLFAYKVMTASIHVMHVTTANYKTPMWNKWWFYGEHSCMYRCPCNLSLLRCTVLNAWEKNISCKA